MRNWVNGPHFPDAAKVRIGTSVSGDARDGLTDEHKEFLSALSGALPDCEWDAAAIGECIRQTAKEVGIGGRESYVALYWVILGQSHGPAAASIMAEMDRGLLLSMMGSAEGDCA